MHDAYECTRVLKLNVQIESIASYGRNLLVGTKQGHLLMYSVSPDEPDQIKLLRYHKNFSKKPIQQLAVIPDYEILICLSDNIITIHDIQAANFTTISNEVLQKTKGATLFTLCIQRMKSMTGAITLMVRMCVAVKRKLQFFFWKNDSFVDLSAEFSVPDVPRTMAWCEESICVGFKGDSSYSIYTIDGKPTELFPSGSAQPSAICLNESTFILGKDTHSVAVTNSGEALPTQLKWTQVPRDLVADEPFFLALVSSAVEVRAEESNELVQELKVEDPHLIVRCRSGLVYVASKTYVWCLQRVPLSRQIHVLLQNKNFQLALKIGELSDEPEDEKEQHINQIRTLYGYDLFKNKKFKESMDLFLSANADPFRVIKLYPSLLPQESRNSEDPILVKLEGIDWETAVQALIYYLTLARLNVNMKGNSAAPSEKSKRDNGIEKGKTPTEKLLQIIDTTLLKCYIETNDTRVAPLLRLNHCHLGETEKTLKKYNKKYLDELIILYQCKGLHRKALELLQKHTDQDSAFKGPQKTVHYLQRLGKENIDLIFEFSDGVLKKYPEEGLAIFTEDTLEVEDLPRPKVLDYLLRLHPDLAVPYLENVIHGWKDDNPICHNALVNQYQEKFKALQAENKLEEAKIWKNKLLAFLEQSTLYTPETVLVQLPFECLFEERAVVLKRLGRHEQALFLYVAMLGDVTKALQYCGEVYKEDTPGADEVYLLLVKLLVCPPDSWIKGSQTTIKHAKPDLEKALAILEEHCTKIPPLQALEVLPDTLSLAKIRHFLEGSLQKQISDLRKLQILRGLVYAENLQVHQQRILRESQSIKITEYNVCSVCKKRFGNQSAFAHFPGGNIVHYSCQDRRV